MRRDSPKAEPLTADTARAWSKALITPNRSALTVRTVSVNAARTVYAWAKMERLITNNPFEEVSVTVPRKVKNRENDAFTASPP